MKRIDLQAWRNDVIVGKSRFGMGLFALRKFERGEFVFFFAGELITFGEVLIRLGVQEGNALQIEKDLYVDLQPPSVFANHSCNPNIGIRHDRFAFALDEIGEGDELYFDYSTTMSEASWSMNCKCGEPKCRGIVRDFHCLPQCLKSKYLKLNIVQRFIVGEHYLGDRLVGMRE